MKSMYEWVLNVFILLISSTGVTALIKGIDPAHPPYQTMTGQYGYNQCGTSASRDSRCQSVIFFILRNKMEDENWIEAW
jgi:hypothetical protein